MSISVTNIQKIKNVPNIELCKYVFINRIVYPHEGQEYS